MVTVSLSPGEQWQRTSETHPPSPISKTRYIAGRERTGREGEEGGHSGVTPRISDLKIYHMV